MIIMGSCRLPCCVCAPAYSHTQDNDQSLAICETVSVCSLGVPFSFRLHVIDVMLM